MRNYFLILAMLIMSISITQPSFADDEITSNIIFAEDGKKSLQMMKSQIVNN